MYVLNRLIANSVGEDWYEIAVRMEGSIILPFLDYFFRYYRPSRGTVLPCPVAVRNVQISEAFAELHGQSLYGFHSREVPITFLACGPSRLGTLPFAPIRALPARFQIEAISHARRSIFMQSPNLTSRGIIHAIKGALLKSVSVEIYLPRNMMIFESIVTGLSTTSCRVKFLQKWAKRRMPVNLKVEWFKSDDSQEFRVEDDKSHVKFMVVDEELVVVGSSNLDRASACTSGEVNVAISDPEIARMVLGAVKRHQSTGKVDV